MLIRLFIAMLALLLFVIVARADKPRVIKDWEAIQYVGKEAEVCGRVVSVTTSPLGDHIYQFRRRIPQSDVRWLHCGRVHNSG